MPNVYEQRIAVSEGPLYACPWCDKQRTIGGLLLHFSNGCMRADADLCERSRIAMGPGWSEDEFDRGWPYGFAVADRLDELGHRELSSELRERAGAWLTF